MVLNGADQMIFTHDTSTKTITIQYTDLDEQIYSHQFKAGIAEGVEALLNQNRRQRRDQIFASALVESSGPVSYTDKDDFVSQHMGKPEYKNAKARSANGGQK
jgi:hypothetical protein